MRWKGDDNQPLLEGLISLSTCSEFDASGKLDVDKIAGGESQEVTFGS